MSEISISKEEPIRFRNYYKCSECGAEWQDDWSCTCNDRCPECNAEIEPYKSEDLPARRAYCPEASKCGTKDCPMAHGIWVEGRCQSFTEKKYNVENNPEV